MKAVLSQWQVILDEFQRGRSEEKGSGKMEGKNESKDGGKSKFCVVL